MNEPTRWSDPVYWEVVEIYDPINLGVQNMTHDEIVASVFFDLLTLHFMGHPVGVPWYDFFRFVITKKQRDRVLDALCDQRVQELTTSYADLPHMIRLRPDHDSLQKAMDIAGIYYEGFEVPEGVKLYSLSEKGQKLIEEMGIDKATRFMAWQMTESGDLK